MSFLPARNLAQELAPLLQGLQTAGQAVGTGLEKRFQRQSESQGIQALAKALNLDEQQIQQLGGIDPNVAVKGLEILSKQQQQQAEQQRFQQGNQLLTSLFGNDNQMNDTNLVPSVDQPVKTESASGSIKSQLNDLDEKERQVLNLDLPKELRDSALQIIRSRRNAISQEVSAGEKEGQKLAAKRINDRIEKVQKGAEAAEEQISAIEQIREIKNSGVTGPTARNLLINATEGHGGLLGIINDFLTTAESQGFKTAKTIFFPQMKEFFGGQVRVAEMNVFLESLMQFGTDPQAQEFALEILEAGANNQIAKRDIMYNFIDEDGVAMKGFERNFDKALKEHNTKSQERIIKLKNKLKPPSFNVVENERQRELDKIIGG